MYVEQLKAVVAEVFKLYPNSSPFYNSFLIRSSIIPLELPVFSTSHSLQKLFQISTAMPCNNLDNSYKACIDIDTLKKFYRIGQNPRAGTLIANGVF